MELQLVTLNGFRRFGAETELRTNGKLIALLGPNEAGKTSLLRAISKIGGTEPVEKSDLTRDIESSPDKRVISAKFYLEKDDLDAANLSAPTWYKLYKQVNGKLTHEFEPLVQIRDISHRRTLLKILERIRKNVSIWGRLVQASDEVVEIFDNAAEVLESKDETLTSEELESLESLAVFVVGQTQEKDPKYFLNFEDEILANVELEKAQTPADFAYDAIFARLPKILFFSNQERMLEGSYNFEELRDSVPAALSNLAKIGELNLTKLIAAYDNDQTPEITKLKLQANEKLKEKFDENWSQSGVHVAFEVRNDQLEVLVQEDGYNFTKLAERSDGLRQFVALQAFTTCERAEKPILLIDEAEIRLHYDAQADLIQMLTKQKVAPKIIYTTHSVGCLPEDLGNGVRLVSYDEEAEGGARSTVKNHFWNRKGGGLEPLLFGMGATTLAFFPIRKALITEGESDMLLLPTMFREALESENLSFQVVPGISKTSGVNLPILAKNGTGVAFALDNDGGGKDLFSKITKAGFAKESIFYLVGANGKDSQIEDFINPTILTKAVNAAFSEIGNQNEPIKKSQISSYCRMDAVKKHFKLAKRDSVPKVLVAYQVLDLALTNPRIPLIDPAKKKSFVKFANAVTKFVTELETTKA